MGALITAFTLAMDRLGPFEPSPELAVAVSGGADSMALALLAQDWVRRRGGTIVALIVDHGLRAEFGRRGADHRRTAGGSGRGVA